MPSHELARLPRAVALGLAATTVLSVGPARTAGADGAVPHVLPAVVESVVAAIDLRSLPGIVPELAPLTVPAVAPPPAVYRDAAEDGVTLTLTPLPSVRDRIAAGCPDLDDPELLRGGADADGQGLCERSVHQARTDEAAAAIVEGFELLGTPYSRGRRGQDGYDDCSSFIGRAYREAGHPLSDSDWEPSSSVMRNASWADVVDEPRPGDILWRRGHVAMALADGFQMHTSRPGDVSHVRTVGRYSRVLAVDPTA